MKKHISQVKAKFIRVPEIVVEHERDVLHWSIMRRVRVQKQVMPKSLRNQIGAFDEWIILREILIIPDALSLQGRRVHKNANQREQEATKPAGIEDPDQEDSPKLRASRATVIAMAWTLIWPNEWGWSTHRLIQ